MLCLKFKGDCQSGPCFFTFPLLPVSCNFTRNIKKLLAAMLRCAMPYLSISLTLNCTRSKWRFLYFLPDFSLNSLCSLKASIGKEMFSKESNGKTCLFSTSTWHAPWIINYFMATAIELFGFNHPDNSLIVPQLRELLLWCMYIDSKNSRDDIGLSEAHLNGRYRGNILFLLMPWRESEHLASS